MTNGSCIGPLLARNLQYGWLGFVGLEKMRENYSCTVHTHEIFHDLQKLSYHQKYINSERRPFRIATYSLTFFFTACEKTQALTDQ